MTWKQPTTPAGWVDDFMKKRDAELKIWRERYPDQAPFIAEEAAAKVERRDPKFGPPIVRL